MTDRTRDAADAPATSRGEFTQRVLIVAAVAALVVTAATVFVLASDVFFLLFLAVLFAILLRAAADAIARWTSLTPGWALAVVVVILAGLIAGAGYGVGSMVAGQVGQLSDKLPHALDQARSYLAERPWGRQVVQNVPSADEVLSGSGSAVARATAFFSTTLGVLGNLLVLAVVALYLAANPRTYRDGLLKLVPPDRRARGGQVLDAVAFNLRWWLAGRLVAMVAVGAICAAGLWAVEVPQFLVLGLLAGLLTAVPFVGPIAAGVPGVLLALMQGPTTALWALGVYTLAQLVENYIVTPLVQQNTVGLPPVLTIAAVVVIGALFGVLALIVATPLAVALLVTVKMLYVEDVLGDRPDVPGE